MQVEWVFSLNSNALIMLFIVNFVSMLVHLYSTEYMREDPHIIRFMAYLTLFTFFMLILVTAETFLQLFFA
jgi:NADH-quinone oxidoreductase subunit L